MSSSGDEQLITGLTTKTAGGDLGAGKLDGGQMLSRCGVPAGHSTAIVECDPEHALNINRHPIGNAFPALGNLQSNRALVREISLLIEAETQDLQRRRIDEIEKASVMAPGQAIGDGHTRTHQA